MAWPLSTRILIPILIELQVFCGANHGGDGEVSSWGVDATTPGRPIMHTMLIESMGTGRLMWTLGTG
jgi:hypothetical protein